MSDHLMVAVHTFGKSIRFDRSAWPFYDKIG
jgi:hypothetical protein